VPRDEEERVMGRWIIFCVQVALCLFCAVATVVLLLLQIWLVEPGSGDERLAATAFVTGVMGFLVLFGFIFWSEIPKRMERERRVRLPRAERKRIELEQAIARAEREAGLR
jgi:type VI protein secretion system component VasK